MSLRVPLTREERAELQEKYADGNESMICVFPFDIYAYPMSSLDAHPDGAVWLPEFDPDDSRCLSADQARLMAIALLEAADHVEFGPGEWTATGWRRTW